MLEEEEMQKEGNLVFARYPTEDQEIPEFGFLYQSGKGPVHLTLISAYGTSEYLRRTWAYFSALP